MTRGRLIARTFELGAGKSWTVILRRTPGPSLVQSPMAALPVSSVPLSMAAATGAAKLELNAMQIAQKIKRTAPQFSIHVSNRFRQNDCVDRDVPFGLGSRRLAGRANDR